MHDIHQQKAELGLAEDMTTVFFLSCIYSYIKGIKVSLLPSHSIYSTSERQCFFCWVNHVSIIHSHPKKGTVCEEIVIVPYDNTTNYRVIHIYVISIYNYIYIYSTPA